MLIDRVAKSIEMALPNYCIVERDVTGCTILTKRYDWCIGFITKIEDFIYLSLEHRPYTSTTGAEVIFDTIQTLLVEFLQDNYVLHKLPEKKLRNDMYLITEKVYGDS